MFSIKFCNFERMFKVKLLFLANTPNPDKVKHQLVQDFKPSLTRSWLTCVTEKCLQI